MSNHGEVLAQSHRTLTSKQEEIADQVLYSRSLEIDNFDYIPGRRLNMIGDAMTRLGWLEEYDAHRVYSAWSTMGHYHTSFKAHESHSLPSKKYALDAARWRHSKLELHHNAPRDILISPTTESAVHSIASGAIRAVLTQNDKRTLNALSTFVSNYADVDLHVGESDFTALNHELSEIEYHHNVLKRAVAESKNKPYQGRCISGPYRDLFRGINNWYKERVTAVHPHLTEDVFHAGHYRTSQTLDLLFSLGADGRRIVETLANDRVAEFEAVIKGKYEDDKHMTIEPGVLNRPAPLAQCDMLGCAATAFRTLHNDISGHIVGEKDLISYLTISPREYIPYDEAYLKLFETETYRNEYGKKIQNIQFAGMTIDKINQIAKTIRTKRPNAKLYTVANLRSDSDSLTRAQHRVIVYGADKENVSIVDPKRTQVNDIDKEIFLSRWAATQNSGYMVIAQDC